MEKSTSEKAMFEVFKAEDSFPLKSSLNLSCYSYNFCLFLCSPTRNNLALKDKVNKVREISLIDMFYKILN